ncbi:DUF2796 domain-containing protein [Henriciella sp. AS95]|uniref:ZrgA family zinc uptake protein n=1 Tax=Henriciella sp. AS95 TaxID=3135782 RepID=UPI003181F34E
MKASIIIAGVALVGLVSLAGCEKTELADKEVAAPAATDEASEDTEAADADMDRTLPPEGTANDPSQSERMEAHVHGSGTLAAGVDGDALTITFEAPLMSLIGFEHEAETDEQTEAINALKDAFTVPGGMVEINRESGCLPLMTTTETHFANGHADLDVEHVYTCENADEISRIDFIKMADYPGLETIDAVFVSDTDQVAGELTQSNSVLELR